MIYLYISIAVLLLIILYPLWIRLWVIGNYSELPFIAHDSLPIERQAEAAETFTN